MIIIMIIIFCFNQKNKNSSNEKEYKLFESMLLRNHLTKGGVERFITSASFF